MNKKLNFMIIFALLAGLVFSSPPRPAAAEESFEATFEFTSSPNPSAVNQEVTFTLAATGTHPNYDPFGYVTFYDDGQIINGCSQVFLNYPSASPTSGHPAECTTTLTTTGTHVITAEFLSIISWDYPNETLTLAGGQTVGEQLAITLAPESLPDGTYGTYYSEQIFPTCPGGDECDMVWWSHSNLPAGMELISTTPAAFTGTPSETGEFNFTVEAIDIGPYGANGSRTYTWTVQKATPVVTIQQLPASSGYVYLQAYVSHPWPLWDIQPRGSVSFSLAGVPLPGCSGENARPVEPPRGAECSASVPAGLAPGSHEILAVFTPNDASAANYNSASGTATFNVPLSVSGLLFRDLNQDGTRDDGEEPLSFYDVYLDQGCDGSKDHWNWSDYEGRFTFNTLTQGVEYCLVIPEYDGWRVTTALQPFTAAGGEHFEIGLSYTRIELSPSDLPSGSVGQPYYQVISASGGSEPYTFTLIESGLPDGLTLSEDGILSGTPTVTGAYFVEIQAEDAGGVTGREYFYLRITAQGDFSFISSANPSAVGQALTFTISASGDALIPYYGDVPVPPHGEITFFANDVPIAGCTDLYLNLAFDASGDMVVGNYPATCTTAALEPGTHLITASFLDYTGVYSAPYLALTQVVEDVPADAADVSINKIDSKDPIKPGAKLVYTLVVSNVGPYAAQDLTLVDILDRNTTYGSISAPKGWTCAYSNYKVTCSSASLAAGSSASIKINVTVNKTAKVGKDLVNNAVVSSATYDPDMLNNSMVLKTTVAK